MVRGDADVGVARNRLPGIEKEAKESRSDSQKRRSKRPPKETKASGRGKATPVHAVVETSRAQGDIGDEGVFSGAESSPDSDIASAREADSESNRSGVPQGAHGLLKLLTQVFAVSNAQAKKTSAGKQQDDSPAKKTRRETRWMHHASQQQEDRACWRRLTCETCGRKGHQSESCYQLCKCCGKLHENGACPLEAFANRLRAWYDPTKHAGLLPPNVDKWLNRTTGVRLEGRHPLYSDRVVRVRVTQYTTLESGQSTTIRVRSLGRRHLWLKRDASWVTTALFDKEGRLCKLKVTNLGDRPVAISPQTVVGKWLAPMDVPRAPRFVSLGSRRYNELVTLVYEAEPEPCLEERRAAEIERYHASLPGVDRALYPTPSAILRRLAVEGRKASPPTGRLDTLQVVLERTTPADVDGGTQERMRETTPSPSVETSLAPVKATPSKTIVSVKKTQVEPSSPATAMFKPLMRRLDASHVVSERVTLANLKGDTRERRRKTTSSVRVETFPVLVKATPSETSACIKTTPTEMSSGKSLQLGSGGRVPEEEYADLVTISRLPEVFGKTSHSPEQVSASVDVVTRRQARRALEGDVGAEGDTAQETNMAQEAGDLLQRLRSDRIRRAQQEETWICKLVAFLEGDPLQVEGDLGDACRKLGDQFEVVEGLLYYVGTRKRHGDTASESHLRLVLPTTLVEEVLHYFHKSVRGSHQGISRTFDRVRRLLYWRGQYQDVRDYVLACEDCQSGKGDPRITGESPGNIVATRPFQVVGMDHVPSLPKSHRGNTELLVWVDHHTGFVVVSANPSREAQVVAEAYERCIYRHYGASELVRHDREPAFMSEVIRAFNRLIGQRSKATLAYRPQANGTTERMVQMVMRAVKLYVADPAQRDWDDYAERLVFALNLSYDRTRQDVPFYLLYGWTPKTTLEVALPQADKGAGHQAARRWRASLQIQYRKAREQASQLVEEAVESRKETANAEAQCDPESIQEGDLVWLFINQVKPGYAKKLAHMWHGPFRVLERPAAHLAKLEIEGTAYKFFPLVHVSRLKLRRLFLRRPSVALEVAFGDRFDFDEALLPEDSFAPDNEAGEYEVETILDHRERRVARQGRVLKEYLVRWKGYDEPTWVAEGDLRAPSLLEEYERACSARARFAAMEVEEE